MARPELKKRQFTIYTRDDGDLPRWKELCPPLTLNGWILEMIEKGIENRSQTRTNDTEELNLLRKKNLELKSELEILEIKLREKEEMEASQVTSASQNLSLKKKIVELLKACGTLDSVQIGEHMVSRIRESNPDARHPLKLKAFHLKAIRRILNELEEIGLVEMTPKGWKWIK